MRKRLKKIISALLAVALVSGIVPWGDMNFTLTSHAEETQGSPAASLEEEKDENTEDGSTSPLDREYTVTFDPNGGVVSVKTMSAKCLSPIGELPAPNRDGYVFLGWYTKKDSGVKIDGDYLLCENMTLYAHWSTVMAETVGNATGAALGTAFGAIFGSVMVGTKGIGDALNAFRSMLPKPRDLLNIVFLPGSLMYYVFLALFTGVVLLAEFPHILILN
ncbi:MAG: InlB B-repeat-containing protein [Clostridia bacterium]|nr:InlB B-repeat-containing protein [Clostridia bacterium]